MRVIDEDRRTLIFADTFQPSFRALELFERGEDLVRIATGADRKAGRDERVLDLELADQRQMDHIATPAMDQFEPLREAVDGRGCNRDPLARAVALVADRDRQQLPFARHFDHVGRVVVVGRDHGCAAIHHEIAEQPKFRGKIMGHIRMVIHVIAREVRESAGIHPNAVEPVLIEPVRGGFKGQMGDALARDLVELAMQRDRIRRRQP